MVIPALLIGSAAVILLLGAIVGARSQLNERTRQKIEGYLADSLDDVKATSHDAAIGHRHGMTVAISLHHHSIEYRIDLVPAGISYVVLLDKYGDEQLRRDLAERGMHLEHAGSLHGIATREAGLGDSLAAIGRRVELAERVQALRKHAPAEMVAEIPVLRSAREVDAVLEGLRRMYPDAPETREGFRLAAERYHDARFLARARPYIGDVKVASH